MSSHSYFRIQLKQVPSASEDELSGFCFGFGALGVSENLAFEQVSLRYEPTTLPRDFVDLDVFFESRPDEEFFNLLRADWPMVEVDIQEEPVRDWNAEWKKSFVEFPLVEGVWVVPSWREVPREAQMVIRIDPGMAFGTGTHETTQLASEALWTIFKNTKPSTVLDVGTGTGILAILASLLGAVQVRATEIDEAARQVARENVEINNMTSIEVLEHQVENETQQYDVVLANIIDGVLIDIQEHLKSCLTPSGNLVVTGILSERESLFLNEFKLPPGYEWSHRLQKGEWLGFIGSPQK